MASLSSERDGMGFSMEGDNPCTDAGRMDVRCRNIIFYSFRQSCDRMECHYLLLDGLVPVLHGWGKA